MTNKFPGGIYFAILNIADVTNVIINLSDNLNLNSMRKNNDCSKVVVQFSGNIPQEVLGFVLYSAEETKAILMSEEWQPVAETEG